MNNGKEKVGMRPLSTGPCSAIVLQFKTKICTRIHEIILWLCYKDPFLSLLIGFILPVHLGPCDMYLDIWSLAYIALLKTICSTNTMRSERILLSVVHILI